MGIILKGEDWKGLRTASSASQVKGPIYCCFLNSLCSMSSKALQCTLVDVSFDGVKDWVMVGAVAQKPFVSCSIMVGCLWQMPKSINRSYQALALYGIKALL